MRPSGKGRLVGRDDALRELHAALTSDDDRSVAVQAIAGMGGIGKSALVAEYYHQHWRDYRFVWWVDASSPTTIADSYNKLAAFFSISQELSAEDIRTEVNRQLEHHDDWLAIFDDVRDQETWESTIRPPAATGTYLITSRSKFKWEKTIELGKISNQDAIDWLLESTTHTQGEAETAAAAQIADRLDGLALALSMAAAYVSETGCSLTEYATLPQHIVLRDSDSLTGYKKTVYETWMTSVDQLRDAGHDKAVEILEIICFYAPRRIPVWLFHSEEFDATRHEVHSAVRALDQLSLVEASAGYIDVHGLVQDVTRYHLGEPVETVDLTEHAPQPSAKIGDPATKSKHG